MIHGSKKTKKVKSQEEVVAEQELANRINSKLEDFFAIRKKEVKPQDVEKYMQFTAILMQLSSDIPSIFNFRRQLLLITVTPLADTAQQAAIYTGEIKLTTKLIQLDPKSYTIWSFRQWLVVALSKINPSIIDSEKQLCKALLVKDQKNFHVWNYRNWVNGLPQSPEQKQHSLDQQLLFTESKIKSNPFNFSPYHFRSKHLISKYWTNPQKQLDDQWKQLIDYGMPKTVFDAELNNVKTAIFLNPNEEAPWTYYSWLLKQLIPAFVVRRSANQLILNMKVGDFSQLLVPSDGATLTAKDNTISSAYWTILSQEQHVKVVSSYSLRTGHIGMEYTGHRFLGEERSKENVAFVKELLKKEETFLLEVIESQQGKCRFAFMQLLELQKAYLLCGTKSDEWQRQADIAVTRVNQLSNQVKTRKYIDKLAEYWLRIKEGHLTQQEQSLKNIDDDPVSLQTKVESITLNPVQGNIQQEQA